MFFTPFLQKYDQFITVFGEPERYFDSEDKIMVNYLSPFMGDPCQSCPHNGVGYIFDKEGEKLIEK